MALLYRYPNRRSPFFEDLAKDEVCLAEGYSSIKLTIMG
jgi:hypothetical protein